MASKELFINSLQMIPVDGSVNVPTVLLYRRDAPPLFGSSAVAAAKKREELNEDFKIDLGNVERRLSSPVELFGTAAGKKKSAVGLTADFLNLVIDGAKEWLAENNTSGVSVMLAEPLAIQSDLASSEWLSNYRRNLERMLLSKVFESIDFLPEPFAVFQYYRYGIRHPLVAQRGKHTALVIDFGGGTCDVCIIETTKEGDISQSGRNSRPLAASSEPVGGFYVNKMVVEELFRNNYPKLDKSQIRTGFDLYRRWRTGENLTQIVDKYKHFIDHFHSMIYEVENPKLAICKSIRDWGLESPQEASAPISLPEDPFAATGKTVSRQLTSQVLRDVFVTNVWGQRLKGIIKRTLQRGRSELDGAPISMILLSGGSSNIGWLSELIRRDLVDELEEAPILVLPDFQEVVAKGLAVECARRFYDLNGDFSAVTYNRLNLILQPDEAGWQLRQFRPKTVGLPSSDIPGVLLPSASVLRGFIGTPMTWRIQLSRAPHRRLEYRFLRSSFDPEDTENLQNIEERTVYTPSDCRFDPALQVQLLVREDGTALPKFIYASGRPVADGTFVEGQERDGRPFYLDMTYSKTGVSSKAYVGLDFGTSNTSLSFVSAESIQVYLKRAGEKSWQELSDLVPILPFPVAESLGRYMSQSEPSQLVKKGTEFIESTLSLAAYVAYVDYCAKMGGRGSKIFRGFTQRSAGPLWRFLQDTVSKLGKNSVFSTGYSKLLTPHLFETINKVVDFVADYKHDKAVENEVDMLRPIQILANVTQEVFSSVEFGYFDQVHKQKFAKEYEGRFRIARGLPPFLDTLNYIGPECFSADEPFLVNIDDCAAISLQPLMFWDRCQKHTDAEPGHLYLYDITEREPDEHSFKAVGFPCVCAVGSKNQYRVLAAQVSGLRAGDPKLEIRNLGKISSER